MPDTLDVITIADLIHKRIKLLETMRKEIRERAENKAVTQSNYDKKLAVTIVMLKNGSEIEFEGQLVKNPPITIMKEISKGICWQEKLQADRAEALYKSLISNIDSVQAELNGFQSINRHLDGV